MRRSLFPLLAALLFGLTLSACYREATDATLTARPRHTGTEPWTIEGIRPGQMLADIKARLGEPSEVREIGGQRAVTWKHGRLQVFFDATGRAIEVTGSAIHAGGRTLIGVGSGEAEVVQVLGAGEVQKITRPKGSGVISIGREHTHTMHHYLNDGVRFEVSVEVSADAVAHLWARFPPPARR